MKLFTSLSFKKDLVKINSHVAVDRDLLLVFLLMFVTVVLLLLSGPIWQEGQVPSRLLVIRLKQYYEGKRHNSVT